MRWDTRVQVPYIVKYIVRVFYYKSPVYKVKFRVSIILISLLNGGSLFCYLVPISLSQFSFFINFLIFKFFFRDQATIFGIVSSFFTGKALFNRFAFWLLIAIYHFFFLIIDISAIWSVIYFAILAALVDVMIYWIFSRFLLLEYNQGMVIISKLLSK